MIKKKDQKLLKEEFIGIPNAIYSYPYQVDVEDIEIEENMFQVADDKKIVLNLGGYSLLEIVCGLILFFFFFYMGVFTPLKKYYVNVELIPAWVDHGDRKVWKHPHFNDKYIDAYKEGGLNELKSDLRNREELYTIMPLCLIVCAGMLYWVYVASKRMRDRVVFDRINGTVTYRYNYGFCTKTSHFDDILFQPRLTSFYNGGSHILGLRFPGIKSWATVGGNSTYDFVSLYTWFMDKNRPLPLGTAFEPYRKTDYERRRREGFPEPLYLSSITTSEWAGAKTEYGDNDGAKRAKLKYAPDLLLNVNK